MAHAFRTEAGVALGRWLEKSGKSQTWMARQLGKRQSAISALVLLGMVPLATTATDIERITKGKVRVPMWSKRSSERVVVQSRSSA